jgi:hypothetical protein
MEHNVELYISASIQLTVSQKIRAVRYFCVFTGLVNNGFDKQTGRSTGFSEETF